MTSSGKGTCAVDRIISNLGKFELPYGISRTFEYNAKMSRRYFFVLNHFLSRKTENFNPICHEYF